MTTTTVNLLCNKDIYEDIDLTLHTFVSGDWDDFTQNSLAYGHKFDVILTSETIYNENYYDKLLKCFDSVLADDGVIYLAAKSYYFGVGGGLRSFEQALLASGEFISKIIWKLETGLSREVLEIKRKTS